MKTSPTLAKSSWKIEIGIPPRAPSHRKARTRPKYPAHDCSQQAGPPNSNPPGTLPKQYVITWHLLPATNKPSVCCFAYIFKISATQVLSPWACAIFSTTRNIKFSIKDFFSKCEQICNFRRIWSHLLKEYFTENFIFLCSVLREENNLLLFFTHLHTPYFWATFFEIFGAFAFFVNSFVSRFLFQIFFQQECVCEVTWAFKRVEFEFGRVKNKTKYGEQKNFKTDF